MVQLIAGSDYHTVGKPLLPLPLLSVFAARRLEIETWQRRAHAVHVLQVASPTVVWYSVVS
jgi:hypothetical protein